MVRHAALFCALSGYSIHLLLMVGKHALAWGVRMEIPSFPKIMHLGDRYIQTIFDEPVEITEKVDGSQFVFGNIGGELCVRSKGKIMVVQAPEKMFQGAVDHVLSVQDKMEPEAVYFAEYLGKPKHNVLAYNTTPKHGLALFGMMKGDGTWITQHQFLDWFARDLSIDVVPLLSHGKIENVEQVFALIDQESYLGGPKVEGVVVKNYKPYFIADRLIPVMAAKYVSEKFKEKHEKNWRAENTGKGKWEVYVQQFKSEARWQKAIQRLKETGEWEGNPRDIGKLIKDIQRDITEEEKHNIQEVLWREFGQSVLRVSIAGFPEWYKEQLAKGDL